MEIKKFVSSFAESNCYLITNENKSIVIDPSVAYDIVYQNEYSEIEGVFITHGHFDHFYAIDSYLKKTNAKIFLHKNALDKLIDSEKNYSFYFPKKLSVNIPAERIVFLNENSKIDIIGLELKMMETFGHTDCSICLIINDNIFTGDTLFKNTIGRTDLYSANNDQMVKSLRKLKQISQNYNIYPGHGEKTTLDVERLNNIYLKRS